MMETNLEEAEEKVPKTELVYDGEVGTCRCSEFEEKSKKAEARCLDLESEVRKRKCEYEELETRFRTLEASKLSLEDEIKVLKNRNDNEKVGGYGGKELIEGMVDLTEENDEEDKIFQLMAENKVLVCEKSKAEKEAEVWKLKFKELESSMSLLQKSLVSKSTKLPNYMPTVDGTVNFTSINETPSKGFTSDEGDYRMQSSKRVKRLLSLQEERSLSKQMAPSTPAGIKLASVSIIDIHDSDDETNSSHNEIPSTSKREDVDVDGNLSSKHDLEETVDSENESGIIGDTVPFISVNKRKRASNIVTSDTESNDDDDNVPIGKLRRMRYKEEVPAVTIPRIENGRGNLTPRKRRLVSLRQSEGEVKNCSSRKNNGSKLCKGTPTTEDVEDDGSYEIGSDSESDSDSLNGFIVKDPDNIDCDNSSSESQYGSDSNDDHSGEEDVSSGSSGSKDVLDDEVDFDEILSQLKRNKDRKSDWRFEGELLAAFGKDPELCMRAVCALYRQQTSDEKLSKEALYQNRRGFSKFDADRGCTLAEFLTDGDPQGDLKKSVKEFQAYNPNAIEVCRDLASRYSKQLFEIYNNKEDPYFCPP